MPGLTGAASSPESAPGAPTRSTGLAILGAACAAFILLVAASAVLSAGNSWFEGDDFKNVRWAIEYRDTPWLALVERHSVHDHIRPFTLMAIWLGLVLGDGAFWGPQSLLMGLLFTGLAGTVIFARQVTGDWLAGLLAGVLVVLTPSFQAFADWNAWMCTGGEVAFGTWALIAGRWAIERDRSPWPALLLVVVAGLFKEPGWIVYPAGILAMYWTRLPGSTGPGRRLLTLRAAAVVLVGAAGLAYAWHPANASRFDASITQRALSALDGLPRQLFQVWRDPPSGRLEGPGLPAAAVFFVLLRAALPTWSAWPTIVGALLGAVLAAVHPTSAGVLLLGLSAGSLLRRWRTPPVGLVSMFATFGIMSLAPTFLPAHLFAGVCGLAMFVGAELAAVFRAGQGRMAWAFCGLALVVNAGRWVPLARDDLQRPMWSQMRDARELILGAGALGRTLGLGEIREPFSGLLDHQQQALMAAPLVGLTVQRYGDSLGNVRVAGVVGFDITAAGLEEHLLAPSLLRDRKARDQAETPSGISLALERGWYAIGLRREGSRRKAQAVLGATDACGRRWEVSARELDPSPVALVPIQVVAGCSPVIVRLSRTAPAHRPFVAPLRPPNAGLWRVASVERIVDVGSRNTVIR